MRSLIWFAYAIYLLVVATAACGGQNGGGQVGMGLDSGFNPEDAERFLALSGRKNIQRGTWLRLRAAQEWLESRDGSEDVVYRTRVSLTRLKESGYRLVALVRWNGPSSPGGIRHDLTAANRLPIDLRDGFNLCRRLAAAYGDVIDYWEVDNEPDISYVQENPETYAAFLKACYIGFSDGHKRHVSVRCARVLMAPMALPPGPYFSAFVKNDGLRYTDGFNYHFYGHAEDFTGVYRQFQAAVHELSVDMSTYWEQTVKAYRYEGNPDEFFEHAAILRSNIYPRAREWQISRTTNIEVQPDVKDSVRAACFTRPRAKEEPPLVAAKNGWLVTEGVAVRQIAEGWQFAIGEDQGGRLRAPAAELPLPKNWTASAEALLAFEYRLGPLITNVVTEGEGSQVNADVYYHEEDDALYSIDASGPITRSYKKALPVLLTEYGYGSLHKSSRRSIEGRQRQRQFFSNIVKQVKTLGIEGALAFFLQPNLEGNKYEYGLLMDSESIPLEMVHSPKTQRWGDYFVSPALGELLERSEEPYDVKPWSVYVPPPSGIVMDFVAGRGLQRGKAYCGYFVTGVAEHPDVGLGDLIVYNLSSRFISGAVHLDGTAWRFPSGRRQFAVLLKPGERRVLPIECRSERSTFGPDAVTALFVAGNPLTGSDALGLTEEDVGVVRDAGIDEAQVSFMADPRSSGSRCDVYIRTENGNLYQTWPRLVPGVEWQYYAMPFRTFTPAFYGRHHLPWRLEDNRPAALVLFFRPEAFPATFEFGHLRVIELSKP